MHVRRVVVRCRARLEYEDAQVWVRRRETARNDAASSAAYHTRVLSVRGKRRRRRLRMAYRLR